MRGKPRTRKEAIYFKVLRKTAQSKDVTEESRHSLGYLVSFQATLPSGVLPLQSAQTNQRQNLLVPAWESS